MRSSCFCFESNIETETTLWLVLTHHVNWTTLSSEQNYRSIYATVHLEMKKIIIITTVIYNLNIFSVSEWTAADKEAGIRYITTKIFWPKFKNKNIKKREKVDLDNINFQVSLLVICSWKILVFVMCNHNNYHEGN